MLYVQLQPLTIQSQYMINYSRTGCLNQPHIDVFDELGNSPIAYTIAHYSTLLAALYGARSVQISPAGSNSQQIQVEPHRSMRFVHHSLHGLYAAAATSPAFGGTTIASTWPSFTCAPASAASAVTVPEQGARTWAAQVTNRRVMNPHHCLGACCRVASPVTAAVGSWVTCIFCQSQKGDSANKRACTLCPDLGALQKANNRPATASSVSPPRWL